VILKNKHLFIVEDNPANRVVYQIMMMRNGAKVTFDRWGQDTLAKMKQSGTIHLIILDLMLPKGNSGFDIFDDIRAVSEYSEIPIVAVSASDPASAIPKAQQLGFSGFIAKPINDDIFPDQMLRLMAGEKIWYAGDHFEI
jgi:CheY-like chemotaxis protein